MITVNDRLMRNNRISKLGMIVLIMAMVSLCVVLWTSYQDRKDTECQKALNAEFLSVLKERANIADGDRQAIRDLVEAVFTAKTDAQAQEAFKTYNRANTDLDSKRELVEYPSEELCE